MTSSLETELDLGHWTIDEGLVRQYLEAVGDPSPVYPESGLASPLALAAYALGSLLGQLPLPPGAIHSIQEVETLSPVRLGEEISGVAYLERPRQRGEMQFITAGFTLANGSGHKVLTGKSTVLVIGGAV